MSAVQHEVKVGYFFSYLKTKTTTWPAVKIPHQYVCPQGKSWGLSMEHERWTGGEGIQGRSGSPDQVILSVSIGIKSTNFQLYLCELYAWDES